MAKKDSNSINYIKLAIMRNLKFEETNIDYCNNNGKSWESLNAERMAIETGLLNGLLSMGPDSRSLIYTEITDMRDSVSATEYSTSLDSSIADSEKFKIMHTCKMIREGVDFLETIMQIHFPVEFPNDFVSNVLFGKNQDEVEEGSEIVDQLSNIPTDAIGTISAITGEESEDFSFTTQSSVTHPDLIDGMDPGLATFLYEEKKAITKDFTETPEGFNTPETMLINGMDPGLFSTLIKCREARISTPPTEGPSLEE
ncbi:MAG: hypothetical protein IJW32_03070 [Clostridia bacterium]|nr:hypothetical protein [Clostridia bacterium]